MRCLWCGEKFAPAKSILDTPALTWDSVAYCSLECYQEDEAALKEALRIYEASQVAMKHEHDSIAQEEARVKASKFTLTVPLDLGSEL